MPRENGKGIRQNLGRKAQTLSISGENDEFIWHVLHIKTVVGRDPESCNPNVPRSGLLLSTYFSRPDLVHVNAECNIPVGEEK